MTSFDTVVSILSWIAIILGSILVITGSLGFFRFKDFWSRLHAASITDSGGMILLIFGMCLQGGLSIVTIKLIFIAMFLLITGPTATHAIANAALVSGLKSAQKQVKKGLNDSNLKNN